MCTYMTMFSYLIIQLVSNFTNTNMSPYKFFSSRINFPPIFHFPLFFYFFYCYFFLRASFPSFFSFPTSLSPHTSSLPSRCHRSALSPITPKSPTIGFSKYESDRGVIPKHSLQNFVLNSIKRFSIFSKAPLQ